GPAHVAGSDLHDGDAVEALRDGGEGGSAAQRDHGSQLVGGVDEEVAIEAQHLRRLVGPVDDGPAQDQGSHLVETVLEGRHHSEIAAASAQPPEKIGVHVFGGAHQVTACCDYVHRAQVVTREPEL